MGAIFNAVVFLVLAVCAHRILRIYTAFGGFAHYNQHYPGLCKQIKAIQLGSEDFHTLSNGYTFITSGLLSVPMSPKSLNHLLAQGTRGLIYQMDLRHLTRGLQELKIPPTSLFHPDTFVPHGISVWEDKKEGRHTVFVVNHRQQPGPIDSRVEKFVFDPDRLQLNHLATFSHPSMTVVNDVQATGGNSFYFTNCNYFRNMAGVLMETMLELSLNNVVHYDGDSQTYTVADHGLSSPNGVAMSSDQKTVYVADMVAQKIMEYPVYTWPDNIQVDGATGHLYVGCHPIAWQFHKYLEDISTEKSPSQVLHLQVKNDTITSSQEVLYDHGGLISGSSSALVFEGTLLIGSVLDSLVTCQVNTPLLP
ncbi:hypothetical protein ACOMHN_020883 [Nucella lapillus]